MMCKKHNECKEADLDNSTRWLDFKTDSITVGLWVGMGVLLANVRLQVLNIGVIFTSSACRSRQGRKESSQWDLFK